MPLTFSVPDEVLSTSFANYSKTMTDNIYRANPITYFLRGQQPTVAGQVVKNKGNLKVLSGGESIVEPLMYAGSSAAAAYSGYQSIDVTPQTGITSARFAWKQYASTITISGREERQNSGENGITSLLEAKATQAEMSLSELIDSDALSTNNDSSLGFAGMQSLLDTTSTIGGISRSSNSWWQSNVTTSVGSFATNGLDTMRNSYNTASRGADVADLIVTTQTIYGYYEKVLQPLERFNDNMMTADGGFPSLLFKTTPVTFDLYCLSGAMYMINSKYLGLRIHEAANFKTTDFVRPANQDARTAQILVQGEIVISNAKRHAAATGITA